MRSTVPSTKTKTKRKTKTKTKGKTAATTTDEDMQDGHGVTVSACGAVVSGHWQRLGIRRKGVAMLSAQHEPPRYPRKPKKKNKLAGRDAGTLIINFSRHGQGTGNIIN